MPQAKNEFDVLIIGAGLIGSSAAMHLASFGVKSIAVVDADLAGRLSSSELNAGGARATWDQSINVQLSRESIHFLKANKDKVGFRECGYLWMFHGEQWSGALQRVDFLKKEHGIELDVMDIPALQAKVPFIDKTDDLAGATFSPLDGLFNPNLLKNLLRDQAREKGVTFLEGHRVRSVDRRDEKVTVVCERIPPKNETELKEFYEGDPTAPIHSQETVSLTGKIIVNCAGPWAANLAKMIGYESPVWAVRRQVSIFDVRDFDMSKYGMMVDPSGVYFHPEATNILGGYADHEEPRGFNLNYEGQSFFEEKIWMPLFNRSTKFEQLKHLTGWGGLYEMTPDKTAILGRAGGFANVFESHGYSGRGAMQSYAAGRGLAELIHFGKFETLDLSSMTAERFKIGKLIPEGLHI